MAKKTEKEKLEQLAELLKIPVTEVEQLVEKELQRVNQQAVLDRLVEKAEGGGDPFGGDTETAAADDMGEAEEEMGEADEEMAEGETGDTGGGLFTPDELGEIAMAVGPVVAAQVVEALMPALDMENRFRKMLDDIKGIALPPPPPAPDGTIAKEVQSEEPKLTAAELAAKLAIVEKELAELRGDSPEGVFRPSQHGTGLIAEALSALVQKQTKTKQAGSENMVSAIDDIVDLIVPPATS